MGTTSTSASTMFTGTSAYSQDLQNVITRAVNIASLPITQLTNQKTDLTNESSALSTLDTDFAGVQTAVQGIQTAMSGSSFTADVSDPTVVGATLSGGATQGNYSIQVDDIGAYSTTLTNTWTGTSKGNADTYQLVIGSQSYSVTPTDNSATSVASAINAQYGNLVQATVVNVGSNSSPDYRLSLQSTTLTSDTLDLTDNGASLAAVQSGGAPARYEVNKSGQVVSSGSRTVDIATGITLNLLSNGGPVDVTVTQPVSALSNALSNFVSAYNTAQTGLAAQRGQSGGALQGAELINQLQQALERLVTYTAPGGSISGLGDLGITINDDGTLAFDQSTFLGEGISNPSGVATFFGSAASGFLPSATNALNGLEDPTTGLIKTAQSDYQTQIANLTSTISDKQSQVDQLQQTLTDQMNSADAMIASMQQQYNYLSEMFQAQQIDSQMYH